MAEEVLVPAANGLPAVVLAGAEDIVETKEKVEAKVVKVLQEHGFDVDFETIGNAMHLIPLEKPGIVVDAIASRF
jgi:predicted esterase